MKSLCDIPQPAKKRLAELISLLETYSEEKVTSKKISELTGWTESKIRHDLWLTGYDKGISNGYSRKDLYEFLCRLFSLKDCTEPSEKVSDDAATLKQVPENFDAVHHRNLCIAGLSRLGAALLDENLTTGNMKFQIKAGFDTNLNRVEILRSTFPLYPAYEMEAIIRKEKIQYAILTVAAKDAQNMADRLIKAGIKGIVNMTNTVLTPFPGVKIENISIQNALKLVI